jgi:hypothetical protein
MHLATIETTDHDGKRFSCIVAFDRELSMYEQIAALRSLADIMENGEKNGSER